MELEGSHAWSALAGAAVAVMSTLLLTGPFGARASREAVGPVEPIPAGVRSPDEVSAVAALAEEVAALQAAVAAIDGKIDRALAAQERTTAVPSDGSSDVTIDPAMLERAVREAQANAERERFLAMKPGEVLHSAEELTNSRSDLGKARKMLEDLLARPLGADDRQKALTQLGIAHRNSGDLESSKDSLQQAIDLAGGTDTESGAWAAFQLAWTCQYANDAVSARRWFEKVARSTGSGAPLRIEGRWNAAKLAADAGDANARSEFEALLRECGDNPAFANIVADAKARLGR